MSIERIVHEEPVQNLLMGCNIENDETLQTVMKNKFNYDFNMPKSISEKTFRSIIDYLRETLYPYNNPDEGYEALGKALVMGGLKGIMGNIRRTNARVLPAEIAFEDFLKVVSERSTFADVVLEESKKGYVRWKMGNMPGAPTSFLVGIFRTVLSVFNTAELQISYSKPQNEILLFEAKWQA
jgi:hypothetical protein